MGVINKKILLFFKFYQIFKNIHWNDPAEPLILKQTINVFNEESLVWRVDIFSSKEFMKNKETTARYYNLLLNQGHAVGIAWKLYKYFAGPESV